MTILVTGATGFIGKALTKRLGVACRALNLRKEACEWAVGLSGIDTVIHLAARVHVFKDESDSGLSLHYITNVEKTLNLARLAASKGVTRFIYLSSIKVNGEQTAENQSFTEKDPCNPMDSYSRSKYEAEKGLEIISAETGMQFVIIRPPLVYGPGVRGNFQTIFRLIGLRVPIPLGMVKNRRSLIALDNLIDFIILCTTHPAAKNQVFIISDDEDVSSKILFNKVASEMGIISIIIPVPISILSLIGKISSKEHKISKLCNNLQVDCSKAKILLGWRPSINLDEGIRRAVKALKN